MRSDLQIVNVNFAQMKIVNHTLHLFITGLTNTYQNGEPVRGKCLPCLLSQEISQEKQLIVIQ